MNKQTTKSNIERFTPGLWTKPTPDNPPHEHWSVDTDDHRNYQMCPVFVPGGATVALVVGPSPVGDPLGENPEVEANAALIAAAPDLYSALDALHREIAATTNIGWDDTTLAAIAQAEAALAKAVNP